LSFLQGTQQQQQQQQQLDFSHVTTAETCFDGGVERCSDAGTVTKAR
jgi:hypothetical protein